MGLRWFLATESPFKIKKNVFYFMLKALFVLEIFTFLSWLFGYVEKRPDKKAQLISKLMTSKARQKIITIHILPNISRSKGSHAIKLTSLKIQISWYTKSMYSIFTDYCYIIKTLKVAYTTFIKIFIFI